MIMVKKEEGLRKNAENSCTGTFYRHGGQGSAVSCTKRVSQMFRRSRIESAMTAGHGSTNSPTARNDGKERDFVVLCPVSKMGRT